MALVNSSLLPLGSAMPVFSATDVLSSKPIHMPTDAGKLATVFMIICNHCPYVQHVEQQLAETCRRYSTEAIKFIAICSNDIDNYPQDGPEGIQKQANRAGLSCPYILDHDQSIAKALQAQCTPEFFIFDGNQQCVYRGCYDESSPGRDTAVDGNHLHRALDSVIEGRVVDAIQIPSMGCNIKWREYEVA